MSASLEPNRIHALPVRVHYHLPSSSQSFTTVLSDLQQVYVYPNAGASTGEGEDQAWGSIYLKTVVQGVVMASPEVHPSYSSSPDLSLYILDPRETYLRRARASSPYPSHLRHSNASSPVIPPTSSPHVSTPPEVWTGKGLVGWALDEPGVGKNLITGRLLRSTEFTTIVKSQGMSAMEALMASNMGGADVAESWGIEVSVGLKSSAGGTIGIHPQISQVMSMDAPPRRSSYASDTSADRASSPAGPSHFQQPHHPAVPHRVAHAHAHPPAPSRALSPARRVVSSTTPQVKHRQEATSKPAHSTGRKRKANPASRQLSNVDTNSRSAAGRGSTHSSDESDSATFNDIPAEVFVNPQSLTKEQAQRLIASPFFRNTLQKLTGESVFPGKRPREIETTEGPAKKAKLDTPWKGSSSSAAKQEKEAPKPVEDELRCYNCGRTKSAVWRQRVMDDGKSVRVCNACGLYFNKQGSMRPPTLWEGVDDEVKFTRAKTPAAQPSSEADLPAPRMDSAFKRTLSAVAEKDAQRIATLRKPPPARSNLGNASRTAAPRAAPKTSPPRSSASAVKSVRNTSRIVNTQAAASSPGGWVKEAPSSTTPAPHSDAIYPQESPNTAIRRILGTDMPLHSLDMPLSDDGKSDNIHVGTNANVNLKVDANDWTADISSFFDVEGFEMATGPGGATAARSPTPGPTDFHRALSSGSRRRRDQQQQQHQQYSHPPSSSTEEDDAMSQLFNRTSSIGPLESSPAPFDFSQLPPSSPPSLPSDLPHSALLLSSPDNSPMGFSPLDKVSLPSRVSPDRKSGLKHSFTPNDNTNHDSSQNNSYLPEKQQHQVPTYTAEDHSLSYDSLEDILGKFGAESYPAGNSSLSHVSSATEAEGLMGLEGDELMALLNSLTGNS